MNQSNIEIQTIHLNLYGMTCANCVARIEKNLKKLEGLNSVEINLALENAKISFSSNLNSEVIIQAIEKSGYGASIQKDLFMESSIDSIREELSKKNKFKLILCTILTIPLLLSMLSHFNHFHSIYFFQLLLNPFFQFSLSLPVLIYGGFQFHIGALKSFKSLSFGMDTLVSLGTVISFLYSIYLGFYKNSIHLYFETSSLLITFVLLGKFLEEDAKYKTSSAIRKLLDLKPKVAVVVRNEKEFEVQLDQLEINDICLVKPGYIIPADGKIIEGSSDIDESMLTGESKPIFKNIQDSVYASTLNLSGYLKIKVISTGQDTFLAKIIRIISNAQSSRAPIQRLTERVSGIFVPVILFLSIATYIINFFLINQYNYTLAFENAISVLVIACPCALGLATPASIMAGSGRAAEFGILFRNSEALEIAHKCNTIILDKTGTLTEGKFTVTNIFPTEGITQEDLFYLTCIAEKFSSHPIAKAIVEKSHDLNLNIPDPENFNYTPGVGSTAKFKGKIIKSGSKKILKKDDLVLVPSNISLLEENGNTSIYVYYDNKYYGAVILSDKLRSDAYKTVQILKNFGKQVILLSGDSKNTVNFISNLLNVNKTFAEIKPDEKASVIRSIQKSGDMVMMIGDGINDAPALATADIGVAIGSGNDIAIETANVTLLKPNLEGLLEILFFSEKTFLNIKQNLLWALLYNSLGIPLACIGILPPWLAGFAMAMSSIFVVLNALRLQRVKPKFSQKNLE